ncbi:MAG: glycosyltransferase family 2 protein [Actinobacteria bacterium]|nr:MAG: glycosyltransferase family 2 protein [Actinomycetota bacterium]
MSDGPRVSVVIPTRLRPALVPRAVCSALAQALTDIEVVVVIDGPDPDTREVLAAIADPRLRIVELERSGGAPAARNVGVDHARAAWTALLDDDDEWLPEPGPRRHLRVRRVQGAHAAVPARTTPGARAGTHGTRRARLTVARFGPLSKSPAAEGCGAVTCRSVAQVRERSVP